MAKSYDRQDGTSQTVPVLWRERCPASSLAFLKYFKENPKLTSSQTKLKLLVSLLDEKTPRIFKRQIGQWHALLDFVLYVCHFTLLEWACRPRTSLIFGLLCWQRLRSYRVISTDVPLLIGSTPREPLVLDRKAVGAQKERRACCFSLRIASYSIWSM